MPKNQSVNMNMGLGKLGSIKNVFARKFRWTIEGEHLPAHYNKTFSYNLLDKTLHLEIYDIFNPDESMIGLTWVEAVLRKKFPKEELHFVTYDGCGVPLYQITFKGLTIVEHQSGFDYESSDVATQQIKIGFKTSEIKLLPYKPLSMPTRNFTQENFPKSVAVEGTPISHLNSKTTLPGRPATAGPLKKVKKGLKKAKK